METKVIAWQTGSGNITLTYQGQDDCKMWVGEQEELASKEAEFMLYDYN